MLLSAERPPHDAEAHKIRHDLQRVRKIVAGGKHLLGERGLERVLSPILPLGEADMGGGKDWTISQVTISGFRGFAREHSISCDTEVTVIKGGNGTGKTSMLDAIFWALTGLPLHDNRGLTQNVYTKEGPRVTVRMRSIRGEVLDVSRQQDGSEAETELDAYFGGAGQATDRHLSGAEAQELLASTLWPPSRHAPDPHASLVRYLSSCVFVVRDGSVPHPGGRRDGRDLYLLAEDMARLADGDLRAHVSSQEVLDTCAEIEQVSERINDALGAHPHLSGAAHPGIPKGAAEGQPGG